MCGLAGRLAKQPLPPNRRQAALNAMRSRGPDGQGGQTFLRTDGTCVDLLHSRLSIIDLDPRSDQPFQKDGLSLAFNGEIYNYIELRAELVQLGHTFRTEGDSEVLLEAWRAWGPSALDRFIGMFAFALYEQSTERLVLARDRFGEKPLYLWETRRNDIYFGSEPKALIALAGEVPDIDTVHMKRYLVNGYKGLMRDGRTFFDGIREVPAASWVEIRAGQEPVVHRYWTLTYAPTPRSNKADLAEEVRDGVKSAMVRTLRADVPVAVRLSGGVDSNVIAGIAKNLLGADITCFSLIEDDWRYDETAMIAEGLKALNVPNHQIKIPKEGFLDRLRDMVAYFDGPPLTISYYLHDLVSKDMHDKGFKLALGGTGADEVFSGYYDHSLFWLADMQRSDQFGTLVRNWRNTYGKFVRNPFLQDPEAFINRPDARDHIFLGAEKYAAFLNEPFSDPHSEVSYTPSLLRTRMMNELVQETVPVMLHDDDLASMRWSVENRSPYLDRDLVEMAFTIPTEYLCEDGLMKSLLRLAGQGFTSDAILFNPRKQGINAPVSSMVDTRKPEVREAILSDSAFFDLVDRSSVDAFLEASVSQNSDSKFLFSLISARLFYDYHAELCAKLMMEAGHEVL